MPEPPPFLLIATLASDETGQVAAAFWRRGWPPPLPPLTLIDLTTSSVADLDSWLPDMAKRLDSIARDPRPPNDQIPRLFAPVAISTALAMRGMDVEPVPEVIELLTPEEREIRAAVYVTSKQVHFSPAIAEKAKRHPFNQIISRQVGQPPGAVASAFTLGVLLALAPENRLRK